MRDFVYGKDVVIMAWKVNDYYPFACAEEVFLEMNSELISSTTGDSGAWDYYEYSGRNNWNASLKGTTVLQDAIDDLWFSWEMFLLSVRSQTMDLKFLFTDNQGNQKYATGKGLIPNSTISGVAEDFSDYTVKFQGSGPLDMNGFLLLPNGKKVMRIEWITTGGEPNKVQDNRLIGKTKADILLVTNEDRVKFFVIEAGNPNDDQVRLDNTEGSLRFSIDFGVGNHIICLLND